MNDLDKKNYAVDQGNTLLKCGTFSGDELVKLQSWPLEDGRQQVDKLTDAPLIICSVSGNHNTFQSILGKSANKVLVLDYQTPVPLINKYASPETLGMDRVAAVCGARKLFPKNDCLVVDFGSCITYDFVDSRGQFFGGAISPGIAMRFKAMHHFTKGLPLVELNDFDGFTGSNTSDSMISGVVNGIVGEIERFIFWYRNKYRNLKVLFCGGDAGRFETMVKAPIFAAPNLVVVGLNSILRHNEDSI